MRPDPVDYLCRGSGRTRPGSRSRGEDPGCRLRLAVTRERIRQIEAEALRKLRHPLRGRNLGAFVEN